MVISRRATSELLAGPFARFTLAQVTSFELDESSPWTSLSTPKTTATITTAMPTLRRGLEALLALLRLAHRLAAELAVDPLTFAFGGLGHGGGVYRSANPDQVVGGPRRYHQVP